MIYFGLIVVVLCTLSFGLGAWNSERQRNKIKSLQSLVDAYRLNLEEAINKETNLRKEVLQDRDKFVDKLHALIEECL